MTISIPNWGIWLVAGILALPVLYWALTALWWALWAVLDWRSAQQSGATSRKWFAEQHWAALARRGLSEGDTVFSDSLKKMGPAPLESIGLTRLALAVGGVCLAGAWISGLASAERPMVFLFAVGAIFGLVAVPGLLVAGAKRVSRALAARRG